MFSISRKALMDLASASLEERMAETFTRRLRELDDQAKARLISGFKRASEPARVRSAFDLPAERRAAIQNALNEMAATEVEVRFEVAPEVVGGIELLTDGERLAWSIGDYLGTLQKRIVELFEKRDRAVG